MTDRQLEEVQEITFDGGAVGLHIEVHTNPIGQESGIRRDMTRCSNLFLKISSG